MNENEWMSWKVFFSSIFLFLSAQIEWNISDLNPLCILSFEYCNVKKWTFSGGNTPPTRGRVSLTFCIWINYLQNNLNASQFVSHQCDAKTRISRPQDMTEILSTYGRTTFLLGILVQSSSKTWLNLFWFRRQDWTPWLLSCSWSCTQTRWGGIPRGWCSSRTCTSSSTWPRSGWLRGRF